MRGAMLVGVVCVALVVAVPIQTQEEKQKIAEDTAIIVTNPNVPGQQKVVSSSSTAINSSFPTPNDENSTYPTLPAGKLFYQADNYKVAPPNIIDPALRDAGGVQPSSGAVQFGDADTHKVHSMEKETPLLDDIPCSTDQELIVQVKSALWVPGSEYAILPPGFGCMDENEISREKPSPAVSWTNHWKNYTTDFSLQMIGMGENCDANSTNFNRVHWHVTGMKSKDDIVELQEGASHDRRMLLGGQELPNNWLEEYYSGPCPPAGITECYRIKVLAHLSDGKTCQCGHQDVLFHREPVAEPPVPWVYSPSQLAGVGA